MLSGTRDDGTGGLAEVKRRGRQAIVQDLTEARYPAIPRHALEYVAVDWVLPVAEIAKLLGSLAGTPPTGRDDVGGALMGNRRQAGVEPTAQAAPSKQELSLAEQAAESEQLADSIRHVVVKGQGRRALHEPGEALG